MFQSTHPHGVRLIFIRLRIKVSLFQSTHPHGVRRNYHPIECMGKVSIHAPTWGATTYNGIFARFGLFQSTHPHGVRLGLTQIKNKPSRFQSTHPHGVRPSSSWSAAAFLKFQSTHPHGVRHIFFV